MNRWLYIFVYALMLFILSCTASKTSRSTQQQSGMELPAFDKEGHRGCRGLMPENTIPAMLYALKLGVTTLEMDTHITKDSQVIISHDAFFNHDISTKPDGTYISEQEERNYVIYKMTYAETQQFDVGLKPHPRFSQQQKIAVHKPLLADLIDSTEAYCKQYGRPLPFYNIETKSQPATDNIYHPSPEIFVRLLMTVIADKQITSRVIIQSFDPRTLQVLHRQYPQVKTSLLIEEFDKRSLESQLSQLGFKPTVYSPEQSLVNEALVKQCHEMHIKVIPWTVNDKAKMAKLIAMGVDGLITDYPNLFY